MVKLTTWITGTAIAAAALGYLGVRLAYMANLITREAQALTIEVDGVEREIYVQPTNASGDVQVSDDKTGIVQGFNQRIYLQNGNKNDRDDYLTVNLLGGSLEYTVDLSQQTGCNCVTALYGVRMPSSEAGGQGYCDSRGSEGAYCPSFDFMKANQYGFQTTAHSCDSAPYSAAVCNDQDQCGVDVIFEGLSDPGNEVDSNYGEDNSHDIDTSRPYGVRLDFNEDGSGNFESYVTTLTQDSNTLTLNSAGCSDAAALMAMTEDMKNLVLVFSNFQPDQQVDWTHDTCNSNYPCADLDISQTISNIKITSKAGVTN